MTDLFGHVAGAESQKRAIHPTARFGASCFAWDFCRVLAGVICGDNVSIGGGAEIGTGSTIGSGSRIGAGVFLPSHSVVGENVFIGPNVSFADDRLPVAGNPSYLALPPVIEDGASVGIGATVLPGIRIGRNARVAAGAVVTSDVAADTMVVGIPARERAMATGWGG